MKARPRVLVTRHFVDEIPAPLRAACELDINDQHEALSAEVLRERLSHCDGLLMGAGDLFDASLLESAPKLRAVSTVSMGFNHVDVKACTQRGVIVTNTPDVVTEATADLGFLLMMAAARRLGESERWLRKGAWPSRGWRFDDWLGSEVSGSTLGIIGMGRIGQAIAKRAQGFGMRVWYHNRRPLPAESAPQAEYRSLDELLRSADHVIVVVPYSEATHHLINEQTLSLMKPSATLTNIARGGVVDDLALAAALRNGTIAAAGLDVYENEPNVCPQLLELENVVLAPHIGTSTRNTRNAMFALASQNLVDALNGIKPQNCVNPEVLGQAS